MSTQPSPNTGSFQMFRFSLRVKHDEGYILIRTVARDEAAARKMVTIAERCPDRAIRRVWRGKQIC